MVEILCFFDAKIVFFLTTTKSIAVFLAFSPVF